MRRSVLERDDLAPVRQHRGHTTGPVADGRRHYILSLWYIISSAWIVAVLRWVVAPRDKGWPCAQPIEDDALAQLRKDAGGYGAGGTMLVTLRDSNAI